MQRDEIKSILDGLITHLTDDENQKMLRFIIAVRDRNVVNFLNKENTPN